MHHDDVDISNDATQKSFENINYATKVAQASTRARNAKLIDSNPVSGTVRSFKIEDQVLISTKDLNIKLSHARKLITRFNGLFVVLNVLEEGRSYESDLCKGMANMHHTSIFRS